MKKEPIKWIFLKGKNKRILIEMWQDADSNQHVFIVQTKTLTDRLKREFMETNSNEIINKILNVELSKCNKFKGIKNI